MAVTNAALLPARSGGPTANHVADFFLREVEGVTHLKLQKLCYYAQGYSLALVHRPMYRDAIEAWEHGPVVRNVYKRFRGQGRQPLVPDENTISMEIFTSVEKDVLRRVIADKARFDGWTLREHTHSEHPWRSTHGSSNLVIPIPTIAQWFCGRV